MTATLTAVPEQTAIGAIEQACRRIAPLWPLQNFVAVNPFLGLSDMPFTAATRLMESVAPGGMLMDTAYYERRIQNDSVRKRLHAGTQPGTISTVAEWLDQTRGTNWNAFVIDEISKWCSSYFDKGQSTWQMPWADLPLWEAWKQGAAIDANPEVFGLTAFRNFVRDLPHSCEQAIADALRILDVAPDHAADFLHKELMSIGGWSAYVAQHDRSALPQLLAIRLAYDAALLTFAEDWPSAGTPQNDNGLCQAKCEAQAELENAFRTQLISKLSTHAQPTLSRKALQAIFCIDVRSEAYRRALEAQSTEIETIGFAGFFGMPLAVDQTARCPVLIEPKFCVQETNPTSRSNRWTKVWKNLTQAAVGCFPAVELGGAWFGVKMLQQWRKNGRPTKHSTKLSWEIPLADQIDLAAGALKNMSVDPAQLAPVVLICGHGGQTENNPYAASLDCGACGGHKGDVNARFAARLFNDLAVREGLRARGIEIPHDTLFFAGLHITTTDDVVVFDADLSPEIKAWLTNASATARRERNGSLNENQIRRRSVDWSEVRPEWGLAGNAAFIAAPRWRTHGANLESRAFLHDYIPACDEDGSILTLILTAPVIVASWINLQYYGSTVNNRVFGSGNKVLHNVVGGFGIWEGNGGDLRSGLPLQSLHDGTKWMHEPLRLQVVVEAPRTRIERILRENSSIGELVENDWLHLMAIDSGAVHLYTGHGEWRTLTSLL